MFHAFADVTSGYTFTTTSSHSSLGSGFWIGYGIFIVVAYLVTGFILSKVFKKAGRSPGAAFVPIYNSWVQLELGGESGANIFWVLLPFVGSLVFLVFYVKAMLELARRFGKGPAFAIFGLVLFSLIGFIILAFGDAQYHGEVAHGDPNAQPEPAYPPVSGQSQQPAPTPPVVSDVPPTAPGNDDNPPQPPVLTPPTGGSVSG